MTGWEDDSVGSVLAVQAWGSESDPQNPREEAGMEVHTWRQASTSLGFTDQLTSPRGKFWDSEDPI